MLDLDHTFLLLYQLLLLLNFLLLRHGHLVLLLLHIVDLVLKQHILYGIVLLLLLMLQLLLNDILLVASLLLLIDLVDKLTNLLLLGVLLGWCSANLLKALDLFHSVFNYRLVVVIKLVQVLCVVHVH